MRLSLSRKARKTAIRNFYWHFSREWYISWWNWSLPESQDGAGQTAAFKHKEHASSGCRHGGTPTERKVCVVFFPHSHRRRLRPDQTVCRRRPAADSYQPPAERDTAEREQPEKTGNYSLYFLIDVVVVVGIRSVALSVLLISAKWLRREAVLCEVAKRISLRCDD